MQFDYELGIANWSNNGRRYQSTPEDNGVCTILNIRLPDDINLKEYLKMNWAILNINVIFVSLLTKKLYYINMYLHIAGNLYTRIF